MAAVTVKSDAVKSGIRIDSRYTGAVVCRTGYYKAAAALDANSVIEMVPIPKGAQILDMKVWASDSGAGRTFDVGDGDNPDAYFDGLDPSSGPIKKSLWADGATATMPHAEYAVDDTIDVTWLGDTMEVNQEVYLYVWYKMGGVIADE